MSRMMKLLAISGVVFVILGSVLYLTSPHAQNSSYSVQDRFSSSPYPRLTVQAWNDASYSFGSRTWMFLYEPLFGSPFESNLNFPFPHFSMHPGAVKELIGKPILVDACRTVGDSQMEGGFMNATAGASYNLDGMEIIVAIANPSNVVLVFKPLS